MRVRRWQYALVTNTPEPRLAFARPGVEALEWLARTVVELKRGQPLRPVTVVPPNMPVGTMALRHLARAGGYVNVRCMRLADVAASIARPWLAGREQLTPALESSAARAAASRIAALRPLAGHLALTQELVRLFRELRRAEVDLIVDAGAMATAALEAYRGFRELTAGLVDATAVRRLATERVRQAGDAPRELVEVGAVVLFLPARVDPADIELLAATARFVPLAAVFADLGDPRDGGNLRAAQDCARLAQALGVSAPEAAPKPAHLRLPPETTIARLPDTAEEAREIVRGIVAALDRGVPLPRIAILYRQAETYEQLLRDALDLAGLPWYSLGGASLADSRPAQLLLDLLRLPERSFGREAVLRVVAASPALTHTGTPSAARWERASREANVVRGAEQWTLRLRAHAEKRAVWLAKTEDGPHLTSHAAMGEEPLAMGEEQMAAAIEDMAEALRPPEHGSSWPVFVALGRQAFDRFCGLPELWPEAERPSARDVQTALAALAEAGRFEPAATPALFLAALEDALGSATRPAGRPGEGVVLGPVQSVAGMSFEQVFLAGLNEGAFPPPPAIDPFEDPLRLQSQERQRERETFLMALNTAEQHLILSTSQAMDGRAAFPSRWLLEVASTLMGGRRLNTSAFMALRQEEQPWLRVVRSAREAVAGAGAPADLEGRRLAEASAWTTGAGRKLAAHALACRTDLPLGRALAMIEARRSTDFTEFDGNVSVLAAEAAAIARLFNGERAMSATAVQEWASCPFRYFLDHVLRIRGSEAPEERWTVDAAARGTLVHAILEEFLRRQADADPPLGARPYDDADRELLREIAERHFRELQASGSAGNPLVWQATANDVWADLETFLREDAAWRAEHGWQPARFEQSFGYDAPASWPALDLDVAGLTLRFRGQIDRIDLGSGGQRAFLYDYKTGRTDSYKTVDVDPVIAGQALQLALYAEAARRNLGANEVEAAYWFISSRGGFAMHGLRKPAGQVSARLNEVLGHIAGGIRAGAFPAVPGEEDEFYGGFANCRWCDYDRVCPSARDQMWLAKHEAPACRPYEALALPVLQP